MAAEIHVGDIGTALRCTVYDQDDAVVDLSSFTALSITLLKPDRTTATFTGSLYTDGTDGIMQYITTSASDLNQAGIYKLQATITFGVSDSHKTDIAEFHVQPNI